jgi:hypothetical protein
LLFLLLSTLAEIAVAVQAPSPRALGKRRVATFLALEDRTPEGVALDDRCQGQGVKQELLLGPQTLLAMADEVIE